MNHLKRLNKKKNRPPKGRECTRERGGAGKFYPCDALKAAIQASEGPVGACELALDRSTGERITVGAGLHIKSPDGKETPVMMAYCPFCGALIAPRQDQRRALVYNAEHKDD